ncbi:MAG TPA: carboxypeptidase regulatory-like domain-containing protein [Terracidiphilus sp.]|nr:carboxypeptidase regulatory-like domain-containing protein [Terracidiphilus sp.]
MRSTRLFSLSRLHLPASIFALISLAALAHAQAITGTVTNKTTGKPDAGDTVVLLEPQAGMAEVGHATTDARGRYSLNRPGNNPMLIRVTHQGADYFTAAPQGDTPADINVYDVSAKVTGVYIEADVLEIEAANGQLNVTERYFVHNTSNPPRTAWSPKSFEIVLPAGAVVQGAAGQRPSANSLPTSLILKPASESNHYSFNFPIEPDQGDKDTLFQVSYTVPYASGSFTFHPQMLLPAQNIGVLLPKSMSFSAGSGSTFQSVQQDPGVQTLVARNVVPGQVLSFTVSGSGSMPRNDQGNGGASAAPNNGQPGGGIGEPIGTPDPLSKYKWWILAGLGLLLVIAAALLLRKQPGVPAAAGAVPLPGAVPSSLPAAAYMPSPNPVAQHSALLNALKEELFDLESEKLSGTLAPEEYAKVKSALEIVLQRALMRKG